MIDEQRATLTARIEAERADAEARLARVQAERATAEAAHAEAWATADAAWGPDPDRARNEPQDPETYPAAVVEVERRYALLTTKLDAEWKVARMAARLTDVEAEIERRIAAPTTTRRSTRMSTTTTDTTTDLRPALYEKVKAAIADAEILSKKGYDRLALGKATLAYVNGQRKLKIDVPQVGGGHSSVRVEGAEGYDAAVKAIVAVADRLKAPSPPPEPPSEAASAGMDEELAKQATAKEKPSGSRARAAKAQGQAASDQKPTSKQKRSRRTTTA